MKRWRLWVAMGLAVMAVQRAPAQEVRAREALEASAEVGGAVMSTTNGWALVRAEIVPVYGDDGRRLPRHGQVVVELRRGLAERWRFVFSSADGGRTERKVRVAGPGPEHWTVRGFDVRQLGWCRRDEETPAEWRGQLFEASIDIPADDGFPGGRVRVRLKD